MARTLRRLSQMVGGCWNGPPTALKLKVIYIELTLRIISNVRLDILSSEWMLLECSGSETLLFAKQDGFSRTLMMSPTSTISLGPTETAWRLHPKDQRGQASQLVPQHELRMMKGTHQRRELGAQRPQVQRYVLDTAPVSECFTPRLPDNGTSARRLRLQIKGSY